MEQTVWVRASSQIEKHCGLIRPQFPPHSARYTSENTRRRCLSHPFIHSLRRLETVAVAWDTNRSVIYCFFIFLLFGSKIQYSVTAAHNKYMMEKNIKKCIYSNVQFIQWFQLKEYACDCQNMNIMKMTSKYVLLLSRLLCLLLLF